MDVIILDLILLLLVLIPILYFTVKMAVKHAIEEILVSKEKFKENTEINTWGKFPVCLFRNSLIFM